MVLPEPTSPCSSRSMRLRRGEIGADLAERPRLRAGQAEGQGGERSSSAMRPSLDVARGPARRACARAPSAARAGWRAIRHRRAGVAAGPVGSMSPGGCGLCSALERGGEGRRAQALRASPSAIHSGRRGSRAERRPARLSASDAWIQALGQAIDRLDRRHFGERLGVHHPVGMDHLQMAVPHFELARHPARRAERQLLA